MVNYGNIEAMDEDLSSLLVQTLSHPIAIFLLGHYAGYSSKLPRIADQEALRRMAKEIIPSQQAASRQLARIFEEIGDWVAVRLEPILSNSHHINNASPKTLLPLVGRNLFVRLSTISGMPRPLDAVTLDKAIFEQSTGLVFASIADRRLSDDITKSLVRLLVSISICLPPFEKSAAIGSINRLNFSKEDIKARLHTAQQIEGLVASANTDDDAARLEADYRHEVLQKLDYMELFGADLSDESKNHSLSVAYISLNLEHRTNDTKSASLSAEELLGTLSPDESRLLIRGEAGSGKSTLFRWIALTSAKITVQERRIHFRSPVPFDQAAGFEKDLTDSQEILAHNLEGRPRHWRRRIPILIRLRDCAQNGLPQPQDFPELVAKFWPSATPDWLRRVMDEGRAIILLDGVDEISAEKRDQLQSSIDSLIQSYNYCYFIISTRPTAVQEGWLSRSGFRQARVNPMSSSDIEQFIAKWHNAVSDRLQKQGQQYKHLATLGQDLFEKINDNPSIARLATNPLLAAMICALHREGNTFLPQSQAELCKTLCHMMLHRRDAERSIDQTGPFRNMTINQKLAIVQQIAINMVMENESVITRQKAIRLITSALERQPNQRSDHAEVIYDSLLERSGLLREPRPEHVDFIHNTFKEYLAAERLVGDEFVNLLAANALDASWQPVLLFASANTNYGFASKLISKILQPSNEDRNIAPDRQRVAMALRCRAVAVDIDPGLNARIEGYRESLFPPRNFEEADILSLAGDAIVPYLAYDAKLPELCLAACVRALRLIGSKQAKLMLNNYLVDERSPIVSELACILSPLSIPAVRKSLVEHGRFPDGVACQISNLAEIAAISSIEKLDLTGTRVRDLAPLVDLRNLRDLTIAGLSLDDPTPLSRILSLQSLSLRRCGIRDISFLSSIRQLKRLYIEEPDITDIQAIGNLGILDALVLDCQRVSDIEPLSQLRFILRLSLMNMTIIKLEPLGKLLQLEQLRIINCRISHDLSPLSRLSELQFLDLRSSRAVSAPISLSPLRHLQSLTRLDTRGVRISDEDAVRHVTVSRNDPVLGPPPPPKPRKKKQIDLAIIVALELEWNELANRCSSYWAWSQNPSTKEYTYHFTYPQPHSDDSYICVATPMFSMGETVCATVTERIMNEYKPMTLAVVGIAGGLSTDVRVGDVVVAESVESYLSNAKAVSRRDGKSMDFDMSGSSYSTSSKILHEIKNFKYAHGANYANWISSCNADLNLVSGSLRQKLLRNEVIRSEPRLHYGPVACGPIVAASGPFNQFLRNHDRKYLAIEMESAGMLAAVWRRSAIGFSPLVLRGISDKANEQKSDLDALGSEALRRYAARNAFSLLFALLDAGRLPKRNR